MARGSEEIMMLHYLLDKALADEHTRDLLAVARRHQLVAEATHRYRVAKSPAACLRDVAARMVALLNGPRRTRSTMTSTRGGSSTLTSASGAGPIGCAT
jgi:hypothetical protein